jgi:iron(III) transport system substrate-binding protein
MRLSFSIVIFILVAISPIPGWAQDRGWEKRWNEMVAEAKKEGKVVVMGQADPIFRKTLPAAFQARFGIPMEYVAGRSGDLFARLSMERKAGLYTTDAVMAGMTNMSLYYNQKFLEPLLPVLLLPDVLDGSKWKKGKVWFMDPEEKYVLRLLAYVSSGSLYLNTQHAKPEEFKTIKEVLNAKWQGKMSVFDPRLIGKGLNEAARFYTLFGEEFVRKLYVGQEPVISRDSRQIADWLARGTYPLTVSGEVQSINELKKQGLPVEMVSVPDWPGELSAGSGMLALLNRTPHPNAARVFVNWMASKEALNILSQSRVRPTTRTDLDESHLVPWEVPKPGVNYFDSEDWQYTSVVRDKIKVMMEDILKGR